MVGLRRCRGLFAGSWSLGDPSRCVAFGASRDQLGQRWRMVVGRYGFTLVVTVILLTLTVLRIKKAYLNKEPLPKKKS